MSWLSGKDIQNTIEKYGSNETKKAFLGVFSLDTLPHNLPHLPILLVVNTDTKNLPGQHWKAVYISNERYGEVFDSLAMPVSIHLQRWMNSFSHRWKSSNVIIQNPLSPSCGAFVLYYVLIRLSKPTMSSCLKLFSKNLYDNDNLVRNFVKDLEI